MLARPPPRPGAAAAAPSPRAGSRHGRGYSRGRSPRSRRGPARGSRNRRRPRAAPIDEPAKAGDQARSSSRPPARAISGHLPAAPPRCDGAARDHRDVLRAQPVGRADRQAHHRPLGIGQSELRLAGQIVALGGGERGARLVALAVVDDAELVPGEGIVVVAATAMRSTRFASSKLAGSSVEIRAWPSRAAISGWSGDERDRLAQRRQRLVRVAGFEQDLALQLEEIGIVRRAPRAARRPRPSASSGWAVR